MKKFVAFFVSVLDEFKKIRFPKRQDVVHTSAISFLLIGVFSIVFYLIDLVSWLLINKAIIGL